MINFKKRSATKLLLLVAVCFNFSSDYMISLPAVAPDFVKNVLSVSVNASWNCGVNVEATNAANARTMITDTMIRP